ncbi:MAG: nuclear transport factor 2 family protein [Acidobacteriaceae bacterium]
MRFFLLVALALVQVNTAVAQSHPKTPSLQSERFARDLHDKKIEDLLSVYTPTAIFTDPSGKTFKGIDQIRNFFERVNSIFDSEMHLTRTSFERTQTFGIEHGTYVENVRNRITGAVHQVRGTYVFLHERQLNGDWLIAHQKLTPLK